MSPKCFSVVPQDERSRFLALCRAALTKRIDFRVAVSSTLRRAASVINLQFQSISRLLPCRSAR